MTFLSLNGGLKATVCTAASGESLPPVILLEPLKEGENRLDLPNPDEVDRNYSVAILETYLQTMYPYAVALISSLAIVMVILGSFEIVTSKGDSGKVSEGKERIMYAIGGLVLLLMASIILWTINPNFFGYG